MGMQVRVLSVQRTNQKFDARQICEGRVYSYFLPTYIIGLQLDGSLSHPALLHASPSNGERGSYCTDIPFESGSLMHLGDWLLAVADEHIS
jgi:tRNA U38,U39,U40 pseudouridine synthase TruA